MIKKAYLTLTIAILLIALISGCGGDTTPTTQTASSPYMGGNKGVVTEFDEMGIFNEESGTNEIFEGEAFPIEVRLMNKGEYDLPTGKATVTLKGISLADFDGIATNGQLSNAAAIEKISEYNEDGGEETLDFTPGNTGAIYKIALTGSSYDITVFGESVFEYKTFVAVPKVCFKEDLADETVCEVDENKDVFSSAAPIQIISAKEQRAGTGKIAVEFVVENVGGGEVTLIDQDFDSRYDQFGFAPTETALWECKGNRGEGQARFDSNSEAKITCKLKDEMAENTLFTKELDLTLEYKYKNLIQESIRITKE